VIDVYVNKIFTYVLFFIFLSSCLVGSYTYINNSDLDAAKAKFSFPHIEYDEDSAVFNLIELTVNYIGDVFFEIGKIGLEFGYTYPHFDYLLLLHLIKWALVLLILLTIFKLLLPVPISYIIYMLYKKHFYKKEAKKDE